MVREDLGSILDHRRFCCSSISDCRSELVYPCPTTSSPRRQIRSIICGKCSHTAAFRRWHNGRPSSSAKSKIRQMPTRRPYSRQAKLRGSGGGPKLVGVCPKLLPKLKCSTFNAT